MGRELETGDTLRHYMSFPHADPRSCLDLSTPHAPSDHLLSCFGPPFDILAERCGQLSSLAPPPRLRLPPSVILATDQLPKHHPFRQVLSTHVCNESHEQCYHLSAGHRLIAFASCFASTSACRTWSGRRVSFLLSDAPRKRGGVVIPWVVAVKLVRASRFASVRQGLDFIVFYNLHAKQVDAHVGVQTVLSCAADIVIVYLL